MVNIIGCVVSDLVDEGIYLPRNLRRPNPVFFEASSIKEFVRRRVIHYAPMGFDSNNPGDVHAVIFENVYESSETLDDEIFSLMCQGGDNNISFSYASLNCDRLVGRLSKETKLPGFNDIRSRLLSDTAWQRDGDYLLINFNLNGERTFVKDLVKTVMGL